MIALTLPLPPSTNHIYTRTRQGGLRLANSVQIYRLIVNRAVADLELAPEQMPQGEVRVAVWVTITDKRKHDVDNLLQSLLNALKTPLHFDDSQVRELHITKNYMDKAKEEAGCRVEIEWNEM